MKKAKFVEAVEIVKPGKYSQRYIGIELERNREKVSLLGVHTRDGDDVDVFDLDPKAYKFKSVEKDKVHHLFSVATKRNAMDLLKAEVELMNARRNLKFCETKVKTYFGKVVNIEPIGAVE